MDKLRSNLKKLSLSEENISAILENIAYPNNILVERTSVMLMYSAIKENKDSSAELFIEASRKISRSAHAYSEGKCKDTLHATKLDKFKQDLIDNLAREGRVDIPYNGLERLIDLSCGTPRTILCLLKAAFNNQYFNTGKAPFEEGRKLTVKSQRIGIENTHDWFLRKIEYHQWLKLELLML